MRSVELYSDHGGYHPQSLTWEAVRKIIEKAEVAQKREKDQHFKEAELSDQMGRIGHDGSMEMVEGAVYEINGNPVHTYRPQNIEH